MVEIIISIISSGVLTAIVTNLFTRAKMKSDLKSAELQNIELYVKSYTKMIEDLQARIVEGIQSNKEMRQYYNSRIEMYEQKQSDLKKTIESLTRSNRELKKDISELKSKYPCANCLQN